MIIINICVEDSSEEFVPKQPESGSAKRTRGAAGTTKKKQPAAKRQKKSNSISPAAAPVSSGPHLSASSSSSSEDEFDSLVKDWNGEISVEDTTSTRNKNVVTFSQ